MKKKITDKLGVKKKKILNKKNLQKILLNLLLFGPGAICTDIFYRIYLRSFEFT